jgi:hypothetical protein
MGVLGRRADASRRDEGDPRARLLQRTDRSKTSPSATIRKRRSAIRVPSSRQVHANLPCDSEIGMLVVG